MFRRYTRGWMPSFDDFDDFFGRRSTIRDTGFGSSQRRTMRKRQPPGYENLKTYDEIKQSCLDEGVLWEDPDFEAVDSSLYFKNPPSGWPDIEWLRPHEIYDDAHMFTEGASRMDIVQGVLGDCWLLAAVSCLATNPVLLKRVVPEQSLNEDYAGIFKFQFWQYGRWVEVLIDDRLPTCGGKLMYMHSTDRSEFWSALVEKAYAKLNGSYEALSGGLTSEALTDFTGGVVEQFNIAQDPPPDLLNMMLRAQKRALMGCSIDIQFYQQQGIMAQPYFQPQEPQQPPQQAKTQQQQAQPATPGNMEARLDNGLIIGHAYSITDVRLVDIETPRVSGRIPMVRVRNPWGDEHEWNGAFSDKSEEWNYIPEEQREEMGLTFEHDGEFWMSFNDWKDNFMKLELCYLSPDSLATGEEVEEDVAEEIRRWEGTLIEGGWKPRINAGGCKNYPSFWTNPQYKIQIDEADDNDEDGNCAVIIGLMQKERRKLRKVGQDNYAIGYMVYELDDPNCGNLTPRFFNSKSAVARSKNYINLREVCEHHKLPPGHYVIMPTTFEPNQQAEFILRVLTEKKDPIKELDDETGLGENVEEEEIPEDTDDDVSQMEAAREAFRGAVGEDGEVDAYELAEILNGSLTGDFTFDGFSTDICRSMVAMKDVDMSGKLNFSDFLGLWNDLHLCKKVFKKMDMDGNGYFNTYEFRQVLNTLGLRVSNATFNAIVLRYSDKEGHVAFDDFVACVIKLKTLFQSFKENDEEGTGEGTFKMDEFIQLTMYS